MNSSQYFEKTTFFPVSIEKLFEFHSYLENLKKIMPENINLQLINPSKDPFKTGDKIKLWITFNFIPVYWETEITEIEKNVKYTDIQILGPFSFWQHDHLFKSEKEGTIMTDKIEYKLPFGFFGEIANQIFLKDELEKMFNHRHNKVLEIIKTL